MALLEVSACRKAHYSTEFFYLLGREQFGQLLGAAGRGAGTSIAPRQELFFQTWLHNSWYLRLQWDSNASSLWQGRAAGTEGAVLLGMQYPQQEFCIIKLEQIHPLLFTSRYSFSYQPGFTVFTQHKHHSHYRPWQFKQVKRTVRTFQQKIFYSLENSFNITEIFNEVKSDQSESESDISDIFGGYIPFSQSASIHDLKKDYFGLNFFFKLNCSNKL